MPDAPSKTAWDKENTDRISLKLNRKTDADILKALDGKPKQAEIKRLIRIALSQQ